MHLCIFPHIKAGKLNQVRGMESQKPAKESQRTPTVMSPGRIPSCTTNHIIYAEDLAETHRLSYCFFSLCEETL